MLDDDAEYEQRRQIRAQADADVAAFIESLGQDEGSGVPPPPTIKVSEVSSQPVELDFIGFGQQGSGTAPGAGSTPAPVTGACCSNLGGCTITTEADCTGFSVYQGNGTVCDPNPCSGACCQSDGSCSDTVEGLCFFPAIFFGLGTSCADTRCEGACATCTCSHCNCPGCTCSDGLTYDECYDISADETGWLLGGNCATNDCLYFFGFGNCNPGSSPGGACCYTCCPPDCLDPTCICTDTTEEGCATDHPGATFCAGEDCGSLDVHCSTGTDCFPSC